MNREEKSIQGIDLMSLFLYLTLMALGWAAIYAVGHRGDSTSILDFNSSHGKQLVWIASALLLGATIMIINYKFYTTFAFPIYGVAIFLLIITFLLASEVKGSKSWFEIGSIRVQPSEFAKFATALALAKFLTLLNVSMKTFRDKAIAVGIIILPIGLILAQNDTGSALVFMGLFIVLYREGFPAVLPVIGILFIILFIVTILFGAIPVVIALAIFFGVMIGYLALNFRFNKGKIFLFAFIFVICASFTGFVVEPVFNKVLQPHQRSRINVLLGREFGEGADYNVLQSKIAIGSGGLKGKGFLQGSITKGEFVPEQNTDFIFTTIGEELGFIGTTIFIVLYTALLLRIVFIAERQRSSFPKIYAYGVASILFVHFAINIGMTIGLVPVVGIPLPFISYGGSSLWGFTILLFILLKLDANRMVILR